MPLWRRNLYILFVVQLLSTAGFSLVFPFLSLYVKEVGIATTGGVEFWSGMVFASQAFTMMLAAPVWGAIADNFGRKPMLVRATIGGAVLVALMGAVQNVEQLVLLRTLQGLVTGVVPAASALAAASTPRKYMGEAQGLLQMARSAGVAVGPLIGGVLGDAFGFRESFYITGAMLALSGVCTMLWVHEDFVPAEKAKRPGYFAAYRSIIKSPGMDGLYELSFLRSLGQTMLQPLIALFVVELIGTEEGAASITGIVIGSASITGALSAVWLGRLGDRYGHIKILIGSSVAAALLYLPQPFVTAAWQLIVLQALVGFAAGGLIPALAALMNLWAPPGSQGAVYGVDTSVNSAARTIAPLIGAAVAGWIGLRGLFGGTLIVYAVCAVMGIYLARSPQGAQARLNAALRTSGDD